MSVDLSRTVVTNAAGMVKTKEDAEKLLRSAVTRITVGSITLDPRIGNLGETYYHHPGKMTAWNSRGLNNPGIEATRLWLPEFRKKCHDADKELAVSFAGFSPDEYGLLLSQLLDVSDVQEPNAGCGNMWKGGVQKPIPSYNPELLEEVLWNMSNRMSAANHVSLKYSPVEDDETNRLNALAIEATGIVSEVIAVNTYPNQLGEREDGSAALAWRESEDAELKHTGGMSGLELLPYGLKTVKSLIGYLPEHVSVIGCGGIAVASDAKDYLSLGARGFAIGTAFFEQGPRIFSDVLEGLA